MGLEIRGKQLENVGQGTAPSVYEIGLTNRDRKTSTSGAEMSYIERHLRLEQECHISRLTQKSTDGPAHDGIEYIVRTLWLP
jgi:hypothetical protein